ncbi:MAG: CvpA family protein [Nitrospira sp.]|nr:CvpA family protein [bacterium]MBL7048731.1 CvpA family protein [Nitrospira sp.]
MLGLSRGLTKQVISLIGVIAGYIIASNYYESLTASLTNSNSGLMNIASYLVIFVGVRAATSFLGAILSNWMTSENIAWIDRTGGLVMGFIKGWLLILILTILFTSFLSTNSAVFKNSMTFPYFLSVTETMSNIIPKRLKLPFKKKLALLQKSQEEHIQDNNNDNSL